MTKTKINDGAIYRVTLAKSIRVGRATVHPGPNVRLRGDILKAVMSDDAKAVTDYAAE